MSGRHDVASCLAAGCIWLAALQAAGDLSDLKDETLRRFVASRLGITEQEALSPGLRKAVEDTLEEAGLT